MRLTLRTLLAYLDNTLDPQDAEMLRQKLTESGFATQLVQRIQGSLSGSLPAPSPETVGPVEDANVISEYLDSTLPAEQVAEIERACLESDPHLAEAAACHQILTMVLGKSAVVPHDLRKRIYELPDRNLQDIATSPSFSGVSIPVDNPTPLDAPADDIPTTAPTAAPSGEPVQPVGVNDSGVSDAPTRLRQAEAAAVAQGSGDGKVALAGSKPRSVDDSSIYGGSIRPSRITPWLVSLALVGALGFAMVRIFEPLWSSNEVAQQSDPLNLGPIDLGTQDPTSADETDSTGAETDSDTEAADQVTDIAPPPPPSGASAAVEETDADESDTSVPPEEADVVEVVPPPEPLPTPEATAEVEDTVIETEMDEVLPVPPSPDADDEAPPLPEVVEVTPPMEDDDAESLAPPLPPPSEDVAEADIDSTDADSVAPPPPPSGDVAEDAAEPDPVGMATLTSEDSLVAARIVDTWEHVKHEDVINAGIPILCAPKFRAEMSGPGFNVTLVGPTRVMWDDRNAGQPALQIDYGRLIITSVEPNQKVDLWLAKLPVSIQLPGDQAVVAISVQHYRAPGFDPLAAENRRQLSGVLMVQGNAQITYESETSTLLTGQQWTKRGTAEPQAMAAEQMPAWVDPANEDPLVQDAREGLLALIEDEQPLEIELREARFFRRAEVGALAARMLLHMGYGDVYFGGDGILSDAKQRSYWFEHFNALQTVMNLSAESATNLRAAIVKMDSANAMPLFRLLTGFSQNQLVEGGDEELVNLLDSPSMAVRVLALENLEAITGTTLYFRPEQENAVRREPGIKKWIARQRKGDIRWKE